VYPALDPANVEFLTTLGDICRIINRPPPSALISAGLEKHNASAVSSGVLMDVWSGEHNGKRVAIKIFRTYPDASVRKAKKVRVVRVQEVSFETKFTDLVETGCNVEEVRAPKPHHLSGGEHRAFQ
jgi:hypothetical protein